MFFPVTFAKISKKVGNSLNSQLSSHPAQLACSHYTLSRSILIALEQPLINYIHELVIYSPMQFHWAANQSAYMLVIYRIPSILLLPPPDPLLQQPGNLRFLAWTSSGFSTNRLKQSFHLQLAHMCMAGGDDVTWLLLGLGKVSLDYSQQKNKLTQIGVQLRP